VRVVEEGRLKPVCTESAVISNWCAVSESTIDERFRGALFALQLKPLTSLARLLPDFGRGVLDELSGRRYRAVSVVRLRIDSAALGERFTRSTYAVQYRTSTAALKM
jgi:hypothetical protein